MQLGERARRGKPRKESEQPWHRPVEKGVLQQKAGAMAGAFSMSLRQSYRISSSQPESSAANAFRRHLGDLADIVRGLEPDLESKIPHCRSHAPDPVKQPVTNAIVAAYISRLEFRLAKIYRALRFEPSRLRMTRIAS